MGTLRENGYASPKESFLPVILQPGDIHEGECRDPTGFIAVFVPTCALRSAPSPLIIALKLIHQTSQILSEPLHFIFIFLQIVFVFQFVLAQFVESFIRIH